jgi:hypothetical protein
MVGSPLPSNPERSTPLRPPPSPIQFLPASEPLRVYFYFVVVVVVVVVRIELSQIKAF